MITEILVFVIVLLLVFAAFATRKPHGFPPGPSGVPILGYIPFLGKKPWETFIELSKQYGDVIGLQMGARSLVVLNSYDAIRNGLKDDVFTGRPTNKILLRRSEGQHKGIVFHKGQDWVEQRRYVLRQLRDFGFGKKSIQGIVQEEISQLFDTFREQAGEPVDLEFKFNLAVVNTLWHIAAGKRHDHDDPKLLSVFHAFRRLQQSVSFASLLFLPDFLIDILPKSMTLVQKVDETFQDFFPYLEAEIEEHRSSLDMENPRDLIDVYLCEMNRTTDKNSGFYKDSGFLNLRTIILDLFLAGAETTSSTLRYGILYLLYNPDVKEKVQREIDATIGVNRLPSLEDRHDTPYVEATIMEILRLSSLTPLGLPHQAEEDTEFMGYSIPKNTMVFTNLYAVSRDPAVWERPDEFYPEHFIGADGKLKRNEHLIPFSTGKRVCLGERLAVDELYLFFTSLLQQFDIRVPPGEKLPALDMTTNGPVRLPPRYKVIFQNRSDRNSN